MDGCVQVVQVVVHLSLVHLILGLIHDVLKGAEYCQTEACCM